MHKRAFTPAPISGSFGRSQGASISSSFEQDFKINGLKNFGKNLFRKKFYTRLLILSQIPVDQVIQPITNRPGKNGLAGVVNDRLIRLHAT